jgi:hypothetical protein
VRKTEEEKEKREERSEAKSGKKIAQLCPGFTPSLSILPLVSYDL